MIQRSPSFVATLVSYDTDHTDIRFLQIPPVFGSDRPKGEIFLFYVSLATSVQSIADLACRLTLTPLLGSITAATSVECFISL